MTITQAPPLTNIQRRVLCALYERNHSTRELVDVLRCDGSGSVSGNMAPLERRGLVESYRRHGTTWWKAL